MNKTKAFVTLFFIVAVLLFSFSCGEKFDEHEDPSYEEIIEIGKNYLMSNQGVQASEAFHHARDKCEACPEGNFGIILAHPMQLFNLVDELLNLVSSLFLTVPEIPQRDPEAVIMAQQGPPIGDYIQEYLSETLEVDFADNEFIYNEMVDMGEFLFDIEYYQVIIGEGALVTFGGEFDKTDLYLLGGLTAIMNGLIDIILAHDINFDLNGLEIPEFPEDDILGTIEIILDLVEGLLNDPNYPDFLKVKGEQGLDRMKNAGINLGLTFDRLAMMVDQLHTESDYQFDDQVRYQDVNKNNRFDELSEPVIIGDVLTLEPGLTPVLQDLFVDLSYAFWEGSDLDPHPYTKDTLNLGSFNGLLIHMGLLDRPILPDWLGVDIGSFFSNPTDDGLRNMLLTIIDLVNMLIEIIQSQGD